MWLLYRKEFISRAAYLFAKGIYNLGDFIALNLFIIRIFCFLCFCCWLILLIWFFKLFLISKPWYINNTFLNALISRFVLRRSRVMILYSIIKPFRLFPPTFFHLNHSFIQFLHFLLLLLLFCFILKLYLKFFKHLFLVLDLRPCIVLLL